MFRKISLVLGVLFIDQICKFLVNNPIKNDGLAFGLFPGHNLLYIILVLIIILVISYYWIISKGNLVYGFSFLVGGSLGNLSDRIFLGYVRDFISIGYWPSFNIADIFTVMGVLILLKYLK